MHIKTNIYTVYIHCYSQTNAISINRYAKKNEVRHNKYY